VSGGRDVEEARTDNDEGKDDEKGKLSAEEIR
jgi:hypothetical protein